MICFHKWSKWEIIYNDSFGITHWRCVQKRVCKKCNKTVVKNQIKNI